VSKGGLQEQSRLCLIRGIAPVLSKLHETLLPFSMIPESILALPLVRRSVRWSA
jgi:hypothetical protein